jgi:hypothetical protein
MAAVSCCKYGANTSKGPGICSWISKVEPYPRCVGSRDEGGCTCDCQEMGIARWRIFTLFVRSGQKISDGYLRRSSPWSRNLLTYISIVRSKRVNRGHISEFTNTAIKNGGIFDRCTWFVRCVQCGNTAITCLFSECLCIMNVTDKSFIFK